MQRIKHTLLRVSVLWSLLWVFVWLLSSSGVQLALRGSAVRKPIWESQLELADSTRCWSACWQSCGPYLGSWQQVLAEAVRKVFERCLTHGWQGHAGEMTAGVGVCPPSNWHSSCISSLETQGWALHCVPSVCWCGSVAVATTTFKAKCRPPCAQDAAACSLAARYQWSLPY